MGVMNFLSAVGRQINVLDDNKTAKNKKGSQTGRSTFQQGKDLAVDTAKATVAPFAYLAKATLINPIKETAAELTGNQVALKNARKQSNVDLGLGEDGTDLKGGLRTWAGNSAAVGLSFLAPATSRFVAPTVERVAGAGAAGKIATQAAAGVTLGAPFGATAVVGDPNQDLTLENILKGAGYGAAGGAFLGVAGETAHLAIKNARPLNQVGSIGRNVSDDEVTRIQKAQKGGDIEPIVKSVVPEEKVGEVTRALAVATDPHIIRQIIQAAKTDEPVHVQKFVRDYGDALKQMETGLTGGGRVPGPDGTMVRTSEHTPFYRQFYQENKRKPSTADYHAEAERQLKMGQADEFAQREYDALKNPDTASLLQQSESYFAPDESVGVAAAPEAPAPKEPTIAEQGGARANDNLQSQIEVAHNAGDNELVGKLITRLPADEQASMRNALGVPELPVTKGLPTASQTSENTHHHGLYKTAQKTDKLSLETKKVVSDITPQTYKQLNINKTLETAHQNIKEDYNRVTQAVHERLDAGKWDAETSSHVQALIEKANNEGRVQDAKMLFEKAAPLATKSGQANALWGALIDKNSPEGLVKFARGVIADANRDAGLLTKTVRKFKGEGEYQLDKQTEDFIREQSQKMQSMPDGPEKLALRQDILNAIADRIPPGASEKFDAFRYQNLLSSPRTQARNTIGNLFNTLITRPATMATHASTDWFKSSIKGTEREAYLKDVPNYYRGLFNSSIDAVEASKGAWRGDLPIEQPDLAQIKGLQSNVLPKKYTVVSRMMEAQDRFFQTLVAGGEYAAQKAKGVSDDVARQKADEIAKYSLFRTGTDAKNATGQGALLSKIDQFTNIVTQIGADHKAFRWFVPFIRTPMNISKQFIEYSPAGFATLYKASKGRKTEQLSKALIGSTISLVAAKAALDGQTTWAVPKNQKERTAFYAEGKKPYSVKIGGKWVPMISFGPFAYALALPAAMKDANDRLPTDASAVDALVAQLTNQAKFFSQQTYVQGVSNFIDLISGNDTAGNLQTNIASTLGQAIPLSGLQRYVSTIIDPTFRKASTFGEQLKSGTPGLSKQLPARTDTPDGSPSQRNITDYVAPYTLGISTGTKEEQTKQAALESFYKITSTTSRSRTEASDAINEALEARDYDKARKLAADYNKQFAASFKDWAKEYGSYEDSELRKQYNSGKIVLTSSNIRSRLTNIRKKSLTSAVLGG